MAAVLDCTWMTGDVIRQPFTDEEAELIAAFAGLNPGQVKAIAWFTVLKLEAPRENHGTSP
jgi:hypothetical protein